MNYTGEQYTRTLWFSEGVTSSAADLIEVRAGLTDGQHLLAHLSAEIAALQSRSARLSQSAEESSLDTWLDSYPAYRRADRSISYYDKGELLGFLIDLEMRRLTGGRRCLRDLFQYMNQHYAKQGKYFDDSEGVRQSLEVLTGNDYRDFFARYVSGVDEIPYDQFFGYVGLRLEYRQLEQVYTGFTASRPTGKPLTITRVDDNSAAARLNLLPGDVIVKVNGKALSEEWNQFLQKRNPKSRLHLTVSTAGGGLREVELPLGTRKIDTYQFVDLPEISAEMRTRRTAFLRGESEAGAQ